ncbi:MAG: class I SAM-dependent methyltransferase [Leptolyngbyaceae bacterium]|nr:class I SAM-dependent methyltransferase [Leptolyngbyaceae bacterium]
MPDKTNSPAPDGQADIQATSTAVANLYNTYPFPPEAILDEPPPGYNWRWNWQTAYHFCAGRLPDRLDARILDAGCGTGVGTEYLVHLNPQAQVVGLDLSEGALKVATERCRRSGADRVEFHHLSLYDVDQIPGEFDLINCVGVLHHLPDPKRGIQALSRKLAPGGIMHIFVYAELGRWEIQLMQEAIALLQGDKRGDYVDGVNVGRQIFASLPENNRILKRDRERWALENHLDANFADMYVHPQEVDYNVDTLFELIEAASDLKFLGFSNPAYWNLDRLLGKSPEMMTRAMQLSDRQRYRLTEVLDPEITHYEFFLARPPFQARDWSNDNDLLNAVPQLSPCMQGWPARQIFNYDYKVVNLDEAQWAFLTACDSASDSRHTVEQLLAQLPDSVTCRLDSVRSLVAEQLILLSLR